MTNNPEKATFDFKIRRHVYDTVMREGALPTITETASALRTTSGEVSASFQRLAGGHILVLQQTSGEILMANPFSAVPTAFLVQSKGRNYYGNCIWDAMGIPAMLKQDAVIQASCACCGTAMSLKVTDNSLAEAPGIAHFALPAAHWWDNVVFT